MGQCKEADWAQVACGLVSHDIQPPLVGTGNWDFIPHGCKKINFINIPCAINDPFGTCHLFCATSLYQSSELQNRAAILQPHCLNLILSNFHFTLLCPFGYCYHWCRAFALRTMFSFHRNSFFRIMFRLCLDNIIVAYHFRRTDYH